MKSSKEIIALTFKPELSENTLAGRFLNSAAIATRQTEYVKQELIRQIDSLSKDLSGAMKSLQNGDLVNSLGICQGTAIEIDRLCGELAVSFTIASQIQRDAIRAGLMTE